MQPPAHERTPSPPAGGWLRQRWGGTLRHRSLALLVTTDLIAMAAPLLVFAVAPFWLVSSALLTVLLFAGGGLYRPRLQWSFLDDLPALLARRLAAVAVTALLLLTRPEPSQLRELALATLWGTLLLALSRFCTYSLIRRVRRDGSIEHRTLVLGGGKVAGELVGLLSRHGEHGLRPVGYVDEHDSPEVEIEGVARVGTISELDQAIARTRAKVLLVAFASTRDEQITDLLRSGRAADCDLFVVPRLYEVMSVKGVNDHIGAIPVVRLRRPRRRGLAPATKRAFDIVMSSVALLLLSPVLAACAVAVRATGPGVFFRQQRVGKDGELFDLFKFRSMRPASDAHTSTAWSATADPRMTAVGRVLRRTSLDELPQLWNILRGEMTIVGPRPERPYFADQFSRDFRHYSHRHRVPVGLTGLAQVSGLRGGDSSIELRARYDNYYIENWSLWGDVKVILRTISEVVRAKGA